MELNDYFKAAKVHADKLTAFEKDFLASREQETSSSEGIQLTIKQAAILQKIQRKILNLITLHNASFTSGIQAQKGICPDCLNQWWVLKEELNHAIRCKCQGGPEALMAWLNNQPDYNSKEQANSIQRMLDAGTYYGEPLIDYNETPISIPDYVKEQMKHGLFKEIPIP